VNEDEIVARISELEKQGQDLLLQANVCHGGAMELRRLLDRMKTPTPFHVVKDAAPEAASG